MNTQQFIDDYELLSRLTDQMRESANSGDWDKLLRLEQQLKSHVDRILPVDEQPDEASRQRLMALIRKILADNTDIRSNTDIWMNQLEGIMQSNRQEQRLNKAYGAV